MHGIQQGIMDATRELGRMGGQVFESCGHRLDSLDIVWIVLGGVLWAALMTTLVMGMIALVRHLRKPKSDTTSESEAVDKGEKSEK